MPVNLTCERISGTNLRVSHRHTPRLVSTHTVTLDADPSYTFALSAVGNKVSGAVSVDPFARAARGSAELNLSPLKVTANGVVAPGRTGFTAQGDLAASLTHGVHSAQVSYHPGQMTAANISSGFGKGAVDFSILARRLTPAAARNGPRTILGLAATVRSPPKEGSLGAFRPWEFNTQLSSTSVVTAELSWHPSARAGLGAEVQYNIKKKAKCLTVGYELAFAHGATLSANVDTQGLLGAAMHQQVGDGELAVSCVGNVLARRFETGVSYSMSS